MKYIVSFLMFALPAILSPVRGDGLRLPERLSLSFKEISVADDGSLHGVVDEFWGVSLLVSVGDSTTFAPLASGRTFTVNVGEEFRYRYSRAPTSSLCVLRSDSAEIVGVVLPSLMRNERYYLRVRTGGVEAFIGVDSQKAYFTKENMCIDFTLPFTTVWRDEIDYNLWLSGMGFRPRFKKVAKISEGEKQLAADLLGYFSATNLSELVGDSYSGGMTNVKISAASVPARVVPGLVDPLVVQIEGTNAQLRVSGFCFVTQDGGCRRARRCRVDSRGRLVCGWRVDRANDNGKPGRVVLDMSFEYDADGMLRRAWTPGSNPLMIDKGNKLYFTGDRDLAIKYREEIHQTLAGLPWLK